ncbi:4226_t:CDS:2 [Gigaspora margarita]|uniref:4226_t:CDS:1 n=1 Tax=Gigaspora margarita TaxID=4874 RepID=A0ABN7USP0_GIGMA|nr:4226_t:CDS:2 [Gigaspora margarita]
MNFLQRFIIIFSLFYFNIIKVTCDPSDQRNAQSSAIVDNKLYIIGGISPLYSALRNGTNEFIYLDLTKSFDTGSPPWNDITKFSGSPVVSYYTQVALGGKNNSLIFMYCGVEKSLTTFGFQWNKLLYAFDPFTVTWFIPTVLNLPQKIRDVASFTSDRKGNIYLYGGYEINKTTGVEIRPALNDAYIFNTISLSWTPLNPNFTLIQRARCSSVCLNDGRILYIGGESDYGVPYSLTGIWAEENIDSNEIIVDGRIDHSSVLLSNGDVIVYGGWLPDVGINSQPTLVILETKSRFRWKKQNVTGKVLHLNEHSCQLFNDRYMFVAYGMFNFNAEVIVYPEMNFFFLDTSNYTWITRFGQYKEIVPPSINSSDSNNSRKLTERLSKQNEITDKKVEGPKKIKRKHNTERKIQAKNGQNEEIMSTDIEGTEQQETSMNTEDQQESEQSLTDQGQQIEINQQTTQINQTASTKGIMNGDNRQKWKRRKRGLNCHIA